MIIYLAEITHEERRFEGEEPASILELENEKDLTVVGPVRYDLSASMAGGSLVVKGTVEVSMSFTCVRCAEPFPMTVSDTSFLTVRDVVPGTESVDLTGDIRESIILSFPANPLCSRDCKGICCYCGTNRNNGSCKCSPPPGESRWTILDKLKMDERG